MTTTRPKPDIQLDDEELVGPGDVEETRPVKVEARDGLSIWIEFADGSNGVVDLSHLAHGPAFAGWKDRAYFESVHIDEFEDIEWGEDLQMCSDSLYMKLTGCGIEKVWPGYNAAAGNV